MRWKKSVEKDTFKYRFSVQCSVIFSQKLRHCSAIFLWQKKDEGEKTDWKPQWHGNVKK